YAKTRPVFDGYKAARYSKKYLAQHEAKLATYRAAKDTMNTILNGAKLPKIEALKNPAVSWQDRKERALCRIPGGPAANAGGCGNKSEH
ncbi:relaxase/Mobilization nuclease domain protein, partial [human gut metagenome]